ncbi:MAG TPA: hypothetical protein VNJ09_03210 [Chthonomonadales bacterium]|nr:hypothetical protein [Chthonomonadales bacterium]
MAEENCCPLSSALLEILEACIRLNRLDTETLARTLHRSPHTIRTEFKRIFQALGVHSRHQAVMKAIENGLVPPPPSNRQILSKS